MLALGAQNRPPTPEQIEWNKRFEEEKQAKREAFEK
jgi:hypothetical protein